MGCKIEYEKSGRNDGVVDCDRSPALRTTNTHG